MSFFDSSLGDQLLAGLDTGKPEEIAALALHLASDESGFTTGQIHVIDGGWMI